MKVNPKKIIQKRISLIDTITNNLEEQGAVLFVPSSNEAERHLNINSDYLMLPSDLTDIESKHLGNYLNAFTQQRMYTRTLISWQELHIEEKKRMYYDKYVPLYEELARDNPKMSEKAKELLINNDETVKPSFISYRDEQKKLKILTYSLDSIDDAIFLVSREISRRGGDFNTEMRSGRFNA